MPPYSASQHKLFRAAAHDERIAKKHGMSMAQASKMAREGVKKDGAKSHKKKK